MNRLLELTGLEPMNQAVSLLSSFEGQEYVRLIDTDDSVVEDVARMMTIRNANIILVQETQGRDNLGDLGINGPIKMAARSEA
jgi:hypothetical protein